VNTAKRLTANTRQIDELSRANEKLNAEIATLREGLRESAASENLARQRYSITRAALDIAAGQLRDTAMTLGEMRRESTSTTLKLALARIGPDLILARHEVQP
jgi:hypothetical protein